MFQSCKQAGRSSDLSFCRLCAHVSSSFQSCKQAGRSSDPTGPVLREMDTVLSFNPASRREGLPTRMGDSPEGPAIILFQSCKQAGRSSDPMANGKMSGSLISVSILQAGGKVFRPDTPLV